jgi:hypothetical protein
VFTISDIAGTAAALLIFASILFVPGYVAGWMSNVFEFRARSLMFRIPAAIVLSISVTPILLYGIARLLSMTAVLGAYMVCWLMASALMLGKFGHEPPRGSFKEVASLPKAAVWIAVAWSLLCILALADITVGDRLYFSVIVYDHSLRTAVTDAITRTGIPPNNPFYSLTGLTPLRYHYFWFAVCSVADRLGGLVVDARDAIDAGVAWCGLGLMSLVGLFLRLFDERGANKIRSRALLGISLLGVTGLDLIPSLLSWLRHKPSPEMEWWNEQVGSWVGSTLWVPHNIAALIAGCTAFLLLWYGARECRSFSGRAAHAGIAGLAFASCVGLALYVALGLAASMTAWLVCASIRRLWMHCTMLAAAGVIGAILAVPYLVGLSGPGSGGPLLTFHVRDFFPLGVLISALHAKTGSGSVLLRLFFLPLNYFMEFGFFFAIATAKLVKLKRLRRLSDQDIAGLAIAIPPLLLCTFMRSGVISNNDFGWRGLLLVQFVLLIWAVDLFPEGLVSVPSSTLRTALAMAAVVGFGGTIYELGINRFYFPLADLGAVPPYFAPDRNVGKRTYAMRGFYEHLRTLLNANAVLQTNPDRQKDDFYFELYARRQVAAAGLGCGTSFGGSQKACDEALPDIIKLFRKGSGLSPEDVRDSCKKLGIDALIVADTDPVWEQPDSWVWKAPPLASNNYARAFRWGNTQ